MNLKTPALKHALRMTSAGLIVALTLGGVAACKKDGDDSQNGAAPAATSAAPATSAAVAPAAAPAPVAAVPAPAAEEPKHHHERTHEHHATQLASAASVPACDSCGTVSAVNTVTDEGKASGLGAVGGAIAGGVLGHQAGKGRGKDAMTVVGALGGALAGNYAEKEVRKSHHYEVQVDFSNGNSKTYKFQNQPAFSVGDHVKDDNGSLVAN